MAKSKRKNPFAKGPTIDRAGIPKGLKSGDVFKRGGRYYVVISFKNSNGTLVRYARPYKGLTAAAKAVSGRPGQRKKRKVVRKAKKAKKKAAKRRNPAKKSNPRGMGCKGFAKGSTVKAPKGKSRGSVFKRGNKHYMVVKQGSKRLGKPVRVRKCKLR